MVIILTIKNALSDNNARRIFGRKEIEIMLRQIDGLRLTQSEKNRLSRDIRPKLKFISKIADFKDDFRLEKNQNNERLIQRAVEAILKDEFCKKLRAVLLFGSFADNSFTKSSDIDICAVFKENISLKESTKFRVSVSGELPEKVDIQVFNVLPQKVKRAIARNHKVLYI